MIGLPLLDLSLFCTVHSPKFCLVARCSWQQRHFTPCRLTDPPTHPEGERSWLQVHAWFDTYGDETREGIPVQQLAGVKMPRR